MGKNKFPIVVKTGQTKATIYRTPSHGSAAFTVVYYEGTSRKRKAFADLDAAKLEAQSKVNSLSRGEAEVIRLSGEDRLSYLRAKNAIKECGIALDTAAHEYRDAKRMLKGGSLLEAARYYAAHKLHDLPRKTVSEVFQEMITSKRDEGLSERYLEDLQSRVGKFAADFQCLIASVTGANIKEWLQALSVANRTRNNFRLGVQTLFSYARAQKYLTKDWSELEAVPVWKTKSAAIEIFLPDEMATLLDVADGKMIPFLAIGAFAGLRSAEIERLDWSKVNLATNYITVDAGIAKTNSRRLVPITDNLKAWLMPHANTRGPVVEVANVANAIQRLVEATRPVDPKDSERELPPAVSWRHNALLHSFCSYRLADVKNAAQVALEAGNSPQMIFKHYRELVTPEQAKNWFAIVPEGKSGTVIKMPARPVAVGLRFSRVESQW